MSSKSFIIYLMKHAKEDLSYVGHTRMRLNSRISSHKNRSKNLHTKLYTAINQCGWDNFIFSVVEEVLTDDRDIARLREEYWRKHYNATLNTNKAILTPDDKIQSVKLRNIRYYQENREKLLEKAKQRYNKDPDMFRERSKAFYIKKKNDMTKLGMI